MSDIIIPSSPADRQKIKIMITEITHCMSRIEMENENKKSIVDAIHDQFDIPKKVINKLAKTMFNRDYEEKQAENEDFMILYETLMGNPKQEQADIKEALNKIFPEEAN